MSLNVAALAAVVVVGGAAAAGAVVATVSSPEPPSKVTICHRTASHSNPYVEISVALASVDGDLGNNRGQGDHYLEHLGPVGPTESGEWGDIIPALPDLHDGLNWTGEGQALYAARCGTPAATTGELPPAASTTTTVPPTTAVDPTSPDTGSVPTTTAAEPPPVTTAVPTTQPEHPNQGSGHNRPPRY